MHSDPQAPESVTVTPPFTIIIIATPLCIIIKTHPVFTFHFIFQTTNQVFLPLPFSPVSHHIAILHFAVLQSRLVSNLRLLSHHRICQHALFPDRDTVHYHTSGYPCPSADRDRGSN